MTKNSNPPAERRVSPETARRFFIEGKVQGVFFREWTVGKAREIGARGWVRNRQDGRVEVYAIESPELLQRFAEHLQRGSPASQVEHVLSEPADIEAVEGFLRRQSD